MNSKIISLGNRIAAAAFVLVAFDTNQSAFAQFTGARGSSLYFSFSTGSDDLRRGALAFAQIRLRNGRTLRRVNLNHGARWANNSTRKVLYPLPRGIRLSDLHQARVTITHDGAPRNVGESYDNWNLNSVRVDTPRSCSTLRLLGLVGSPLVRFTGSRKARSLDLRITPGRAHVTVPFLNLTFGTGRDDLRRGALAFAQIRLRNGRTLPRVNLNRGRTWPNNSINTLRLPLPPRISLGALSSITISHDGAPRNVGESYDNWNLRSVTAQTPRVCSSSRNLATVGRQWVRFTGSLKSRSFLLSVR